MSSKPSSIRPSSTSTPTPAVKPPTQIHPSAIIAEKAQLTGTHLITLGENAVIHPYAHIRSDFGKVVIGRRSMVYERAIVGFASITSDGEEAVVIGDDVNIDTGAVVEAREVGEGTEVGVNARLGKGAVVGKWCKIGALETLGDVERVEDFTVVFGGGKRRRDVLVEGNEEVREARRTGQVKAVEAMRRCVPNAGAKWMG